MPFPRSLSRLPFLLVGLLAFLSATGCANYQLGTGSAPKFSTLYIEPVGNKTLLPQSRALLSTQLRETFLRDGRVSLVNSPDSADAVLTVVIDDYHRDAVTAQRNDTGLARKFNVTLGATCTLRDNRAGKNFFENRQIVAVREVFTEGSEAESIAQPLARGNQLQSEYQTLPLLADTLAGKVVHAALDIW